MRAMTMPAYGGPATIVQSDLPVPQPGPGQLLLRVLAHSVNPVDWKLASGAARPVLTARFPHVPGFDVCGVVAGLGAGVSDFHEGDLVHARINHQSGGACAEYAVAGADVSARVPPGMDPGEAAGLPLAGMTALQGLRDKLGLPMSGATERVLIVGASGGVGHLAVQIAVAAGAHVVGVCSGRNAAFVSSLGAHAVIDYTKPTPYDGVAPFDVIYDCVGGAPSGWFPLLTKSGRFASCLPGPAAFGWSLLNPLRARKVHAVLLKSNAADLRTLDMLVEAGKLRVVVDSRFPLAELEQAWERSIEGRAAGKIVVEVGTR
jgi:chloroplastic oxoene reductase